MSKRDSDCDCDTGCDCVAVTAIRFNDTHNPRTVLPLAPTNDRVNAQLLNCRQTLSNVSE